MMNDVEVMQRNIESKDDFWSENKNKIVLADPQREKYFESIWNQFYIQRKLSSPGSFQSEKPHKWIKDSRKEEKERKDKNLLGC
jgi:hypothetical protein